LVYFEVIWHIFPSFGIFCHVISGNPGIIHFTLIRFHEFSLHWSVFLRIKCGFEICQRSVVKRGFVSCLIKAKLCLISGPKGLKRKKYFKFLKRQISMLGMMDIFGDCALFQRQNGDF
jgi:hypothetical protein